MATGILNEKTNQQVTLVVKNEIKLDPKSPIPIEYNGTSFNYIVRSRRYIPFLGKKDNLPQLLLEARVTSTTQNACIGTISQSVIGKGLATTDATIDSDLQEWMKCVNNDGQSFDEVMLGTVDGERTFGNQFIEIRRGELAGKKFLKAYNHSMLYCRLGMDDQGKPDGTVLISKLFAKRGYQLPNDVETIPLYSPNALDQKKCWKQNTDGTESTMLHFKNEVSGIDDYGMPASVAGIRYQVLEGKSAQYNIDNFENNMVLGGMLIFKSAMTQTEAKANAKEIMLSHVGEGKTGRIAVISSESGLADVDWKPYETQKEGSYIELDRRIEQKIIAANNWDAILAGIHEGKGGLGNGSGYVRSIYDVKEAILLKPLRTKLINKVVVPIMKIYADHFGVSEVAKYEFTFHSSMPFSFMSDIDPASFVKVNEARGMAGMDPDKNNGDKFLAEMQSKQNVQTKPTTKEGNNNN